MAFFNEFPHTRNYDADLGWIICHIKKLLTEYGSLDNWRAEHETEYKELKDKVDGLIDNLINIISPWDPSIAYKIYTIVEYSGSNYIAIQDVPIGTNITDTNYWEPANTVIQQINAIAGVTDTITHYLDAELRSTLSAVYMGDFVHETAYPQGMCVANGKVYTLSTYNNANNECLLRVFDIATNAEVDSQVILAGHGQTIVYCPDNNCFYIAPVFDSSVTPRVKWPVLFKYNASFNLVATIPVANTIQSMSYDFVTGTFYIVDYYWRVYIFDPNTDTMTFYESISYAFNLTPNMIEYNQELAVYDGAWYMSDPHNYIVGGHFGETWLKHYYVPHLDGSDFHHLGEIEGMDFDEDGNLNAMFTVGLTDDVYCGIIADISNHAADEVGTPHHTYKDTATLELSNTSQAKFKLSTHEIRSLRQLAMINTEAPRVALDGTVTEVGANLRMLKSVTMNIHSGSTLQIGKVTISAPFFSLYGDGIIQPYAGTTILFSSESGTRMMFGGNITIDNSAAMEFIHIKMGAGAEAIVTDKYSSTNTLTVNGDPYANNRVYTREKYTPVHIEAGSEVASIPSGSDYVDISVLFDVPFTATPAVIVTPYSGTSTQNNIANPMVSSASTTGFTCRYWRVLGATNTQTINHQLHWAAFDK